MSDAATTTTSTSTSARVGGVTPASPGSRHATSDANDMATARYVGLERGGGAPRGRRQSPVWRIRGELPVPVRFGLGAVGLAVLFGFWQMAATVWAGDSFLVPTPVSTIRAFGELWSSGDLPGDLRTSMTRVVLGYAISIAIGVVVGIGLGSFASVEAFLEAPIGFLRYIPATALTPLFLLWLGIGESPKVALIVVGSVFFNILMIADVARGVPSELINVSYTLGAGRLTVLRKVILPHSWPGIVDVARINLAAAWVMLVVAELLAAEEGLAFRIVRAQRFRQVDRMFALLLLFGAIGMVSDLALRALRNRSARWARP
jgi:NitT/TauT family transport system permease protein